LRGIVFDEDGYALTCGAVKKKTKRYRYYISTQAVKRSYADSPLRTVPATILEDLIVDQMRRLLSRPEWTKQVLTNPQWGEISDPQMEQKIVRALENFEQLWDELFPVERERLVKLLIQRIIVTLRKVRIELRPVGMIGLLHEIMPDANISKVRPTKDAPITIEMKFR
jgi:site-specific DNA recombinase